MASGKRQQHRRGRNWYLLLIALFLLGLMLGTHLSKRMAGQTGQAPVSTPAPSEAPGGTAPAVSPQEPAETISPPASASETPSETPSEVPSEAPSDPPSEPSPVEPSDQLRELLDGMSLREKVCQMFVVFPSDLTGVAKVTQAGEATRQALEQYPVGGLLYDASNMVSQDQVREMLETTQGYSKLPLILTCDEEGGRVARLMNTVGTTNIGPMLDYAHLGPDAARTNAQTIARDMVSCGFNTDLAPVADVWSNPENTVIGDRAYSRDFTQAAELIPAAVEGFHLGGTACALKHFPGHGDTKEDSHSGAAYVDKTLEQLRQEELLPFRAGIGAGADLVMLGHLTVGELDSEPAPFSHRIVTGLLREELGFDGVVITDSLKMKAVTDHYSSEEAAVKAVRAGVDLLLCPEDLDAAVEGLVRAVESGGISRERIDESVLRILNMKRARGIL